MGGTASMAARVRAGVAETPTRLWLLAALLVAEAVLLGLAGTGTVAAAQDAVTRSSDQHRLHLSLADADRYSAEEYLSNAGCTTTDPGWNDAAHTKLTYCAGSVEVTGARTQYQDAMARTTAELKQVATDAGAGGQASERFQELDARLTEYTGLIETGRANTRQGYPVGGAYLRAASASMLQPGDGILARVDAMDALDTTDQGPAAGPSLPAALVVLLAALLLTLVLVHRHVSRRFRRRYNAPLAAAIAVLLPMAAWTGLLVFEVGQVPGAAQAQTLARWHDLLRADALAHDVAAEQSFALVPGGSETPVDAGMKQLGDLLRTEAGRAAQGPEQAAAARAEADYRLLAATHATIEQDGVAGKFGDAVELVTAGGPPGCGQRGFDGCFARFDASMSQVIQVDQGALAAGVGLGSGPDGVSAGAGGAVRLLPLGLAAAVVLLAVGGLLPRIREYDRR
jgi:hypothetical protein